MTARERKSGCPEESLEDGLFEVTGRTCCRTGDGEGTGEGVDGGLEIESSATAEGCSGDTSAAG